MMKTYLTENHRAILDQAPSVASIQSDAMSGWGFVPTKRDGGNVLWEAENWTEINFWLPAHHTDLSLTYIMMLCYKAGVLNGRDFEINEQRIHLGFAPMTAVDRERLASFQQGWIYADYANRTPEEFAGS